MKNFISKLTFKKANIITIAISLILSALAVLLVFCEYPSDSAFNSGFIILLITSLVLFIYITSYTIIGWLLFDLPEKQAKEIAIKNFNLTKDNYVEVDFDCVAATNALLVFLLLAHSEYYFYVKLNENEKLHLLVENTNKDVIYNSTIRFTYFNEHFKKTT